MLKNGEKGVVVQRDKQTYAIVPHTPGGIIDAEALRRIAAVVERYKIEAIKITSAERIALFGVRDEDLDAIWQELSLGQGAATGLCIRSVKACPGTAFCRLGQQDALGLGMELDRRFHGMPLPWKFKIGVSGCVNQCAENAIKDLGFFGKPHGWSVTVGGNGGSRPRLAVTLAEGLNTAEALLAAEKIIRFFESQARKPERMGALIERVGIEALRAVLENR